jgi:hypothetical protein
MRELTAADARAIERGYKAAAMLDAFGEMLDEMQADAIKDLLNAPPEQVLAMQLYAKGLKQIKERLERRVSDARAINNAAKQ